MASHPVYMTGLTKAEAEQRALIFKTTPGGAWTTEIIQEDNGTYTLKATPPGG